MFFFRKRLKKSSKEDYEKFAEELTENGVDAKGRWAMVISAFLVLVIPTMLVLLAFVGAFMLLFWLFL